jgi:beta-lactamase class A
VTIARVLDVPELADTTWSVAAAQVGGRLEELSGSVLLRTASIGKIFLLIEVARQLEQGEIRAGALLDRARVAPVHDSGLWQHLAVRELAIEDAARLVGVASDNWATNALLDVVGLAAVDARATELAHGGSRLLDQVRDVRAHGHPETLSVGCAADWVAIMTGLWHGTVVSEAVSRRVLDWLSGGFDLSMVAGAFGLDPLAHVARDRGFAVWCKTGTDAGVRADVGLVEGPRALVAYAVICNWDPATDTPRDAVLDAMRGIGTHLRALCG